MNHVLTDVEPIPPEEGLTCKCGKTATQLWPAHYKIAEAYCQACLEETQFKLLVALGLASMK